VSLIRQSLPLDVIENQEGERPVTESTKEKTRVPHAVGVPEDTATESVGTVIATV